MYYSHNFEFISLGEARREARRKVGTTYFHVISWKNSGDGTLAIAGDCVHDKVSSNADSTSYRSSVIAERGR